MSNIAQVAGNNGVSGTGAPGTPSGALGATYTDDGTFAVTGSNAVRRSVSKTGSAVSNVVSVTSGLRFAYSGVECDLPTLAATRTGA